jgi:hypothetical protein
MEAQACGNLRACGGLAWSAGHAADALAGHKYQTKEFLTLNKLDTRKSLKVSHRDASMRACVDWVNLKW